MHALFSWYGHDGRVIMRNGGPAHIFIEAERPSGEHPHGKLWVCGMQ